MISAVTIAQGTTPVELTPAFNRCCHIQNLSDANVFIKFDDSVTAVTTANGIQIFPNMTYVLENRHTHWGQTYKASVTAVHDGTGNKVVRVQAL